VELQAARSEMAKLRAGQHGASLGVGAAAAAREFLQITPAETSAQTDVIEHSDVAAEDGPEADPLVSTNTPPLTAAIADVPQTNDFKEQLEAATKLWDVRANLARNSFLENLNASPDEATRFDVLIEAMNLRLDTHIREWVDGVSEQGVVRAEDGARLIHHLSGAVVITYDEMDRSLPVDWREATDAEFKLFDFIDPSVAEPLVDVEHLMETFEP